jgi:hypothetical protein
MNTNGLAKHYGILTPEERLPLILAAADRGDAAEADRLAHTAPRKGWELPDYHGFGQALLVHQPISVAAEPPERGAGRPGAAQRRLTWGPWRPQSLRTLAPLLLGTF